MQMQQQVEGYLDRADTASTHVESLFFREGRGDRRREREKERESRGVHISW